ncbi:hypothetical protein Bca4012_008829 [Brassica carinata]
MMLLLAHAVVGEKPKLHIYHSSHSLALSDFLFPWQVTSALSHAGLESSNLIVGINVTKSNERTGLTSFSPIIERAMTIVEESGGQYHVFLIIADEQITKAVLELELEFGYKQSQTYITILNAWSMLDQPSDLKINEEMILETNRDFKRKLEESVVALNQSLWGLGSFFFSRTSS